MWNLGHWAVEKLVRSRQRCMVSIVCGIQSKGSVVDGGTSKATAVRQGMKVRLRMGLILDVACLLRWKGNVSL